MIDSEVLIRFGRLGMVAKEMVVWKDGKYLDKTIDS